MEIKTWHNAAFAWTGFLAVASFAVFVVIAMNTDPSWVFGEDVFSSLRNHANDTTRYFDAGCAVGGLLLTVFGIGNILYHRNQDQAIGGGLVAVAGIALALVVLTPTGATPEDLCYYFGHMFALLMLMSLAAFAIGNWVAGHKVFAGVSLILFASGIAAIMTFDLAKAETYGLFIGSIWVVLESIRMMIEKTEIGRVAHTFDEVRQ
ncbi:MAG: DUF998 domain-containing protein [Candidatus Methanoplasma sp.]|jgi:hypothetical membrane protein|nr:DUF998 domain-containing protein [Candidatus Methanoplasma sp.]